MTTGRLERALAEGRFAITAELGPPKSADAEVVRRKARELRPHVDAANITDNQTAVARMSSLAGAAIMLSEGLEPVMQVVSRDRNRLALTSELLGAGALKVPNVMCLGGDPVHVGNHPEAKSVHDLDAVGLIRLAAGLVEGRFSNGEPCDPAPRLFVGSGENPFNDTSGGERLAAKVRAGARFIQTQAIFDVEAFGAWMSVVRSHGLHEKVAILAGIVPLKSARMAGYMREKVPGVVLPLEVVERMGKADTKEAARLVGIEIAAELIDQLREIRGIGGIHVMAVEWEEAVGRVLKAAGLGRGR